MWYTCRDNTRYGPYTTDDVVNYLKCGNILGSDLVYVTKEKRWERLDTCKEFSDIVKAVSYTPVDKGANPFSVAGSSFNKFFEGGTHGYGFLFISAIFSTTFMYFVIFMMLLVASLSIIVPALILGLFLLFIPIIGWIVLLLGAILISIWVAPLFLVVFVPLGCICGFYVNGMCLSPMIWFNCYVNSKGQDKNSRSKLICAFAATLILSAGLLLLAIIGSITKN